MAEPQPGKRPADAEGMLLEARVEAVERALAALVEAGTVDADGSAAHVLPAVFESELMDGAAPGDAVDACLAHVELGARRREAVREALMEAVCPPEGGDDSSDASGGGADEKAEPVRAAGDPCLAVLDEDGAWHEAVVEEVLDGGARFRVLFTEWGKPQDAPADGVLFAEDGGGGGGGGGDDVGACEMCERVMPLTKHHLRPRSTHARLRRKGFSRAVLNTCAMLCRACHSACHKARPNNELADSFYTVELLMELPELQRWARWCARQSVSSRRLKQQLPVD